MEDIFSQMLSFVDSEMNAENGPNDLFCEVVGDICYDKIASELIIDAKFNSATKKVTKDIMKIEAPNIIAERPAPVYEFDSTNNLLDPDVLGKFTNEGFPQLAALTEPIPTTFTMEGFLTNVMFHESELIQRVIPDEDIVIVKCNYGKCIYEGYTEPTRVKTSNRGRKRKEKKRKQRKVQGTGNDFNSQISFHVRSCNDADTFERDGMLIVPPTAAVYKFKVFRNGVIQLPGVRPDIIEDVLGCVAKLVSFLNTVLHTFVTDGSKISRAVNLNPVMKNYKFAVITDGKMVDLSKLREVLQEERRQQIAAAQNGVELAPGTRIFDAKYNRSDTKLSIEFSTPIPKKKDKKTRVNIFMRGKINILGAFENEYTRNIAIFLSGIFEKNNLII